jgi:hypothetical protein
MSGTSLAEREPIRSAADLGRPAREQAPPLVAWLWAAAFAALMVTAFFHAAGQVEIPQSQAFLEFNQRRVNEFAERRKTEELRVVMLGNSRLKYGTLDEDQLAGLAAESGYGQTRFLRLVNNWAVFEDFASLRDALLAARPHVLVIQLELLAQERAQDARALLLREYAQWRIFGRGPWNPGDVDQAELQYATPCADGQSPEALEERKRRIRRWLRFQPDGPSSRLARAFIAQATAQGTAVVLLAIPRTSTMETAFQSTSDEMLAAARRLLSHHRQIDLLEPSGPPDRQYCDLVHMAEPARRTFSAWLVGALSTLSERARRGSPASS